MRNPEYLRGILRLRCASLRMTNSIALASAQVGAAQVITPRIRAVASECARCVAVKGCESSLCRLRLRHSSLAPKRDPEAAPEYQIRCLARSRKVQTKLYAPPLEARSAYNRL